MLELPESYTYAGQMRQALASKTVERVIVGQTPHRFAFYSEHKDEYEQLLKGRAVIGAKNLGGILELDFDGCFIYFSDGSYPKFYDGEPPLKHQLLIGFTDGTGFTVSVQMYGTLHAYKTGECRHDYYISSATRLNPLSEGFTFDYFNSLYKPNGKKLSAKAFLATEQRIPGIGNGVLQDILFAAKIDPRFDMRDATQGDMFDLYQSVCSVIKKMCEEGGRNTEKDFFGNSGGYACVLSKAALGTSCPRCSELIDKAPYMGGAVYFCQNCQKR